MTRGVEPAGFTGVDVSVVSDKVIVRPWLRASSHEFSQHKKPQRISRRTYALIDRADFASRIRPCVKCACQPENADTSSFLLVKEPTTLESFSLSDRIRPCAKCACHTQKADTSFFLLAKETTTLESFSVSWSIAQSKSRSTCTAMETLPGRIPTFSSAGRAESALSMCRCSHGGRIACDACGHLAAKPQSKRSALDSHHNRSMF